MLYLKRYIAVMSMLLIVGCATDTLRKPYPDKVDISGFEELTPDEFLELTAGRSFKGVHRGLEYVQSHPQDKSKRVYGIYNGEPYNGYWTEGENNCTVIIFNFSELPNCWKLLHKDGEYIYAYYNIKGTKMHLSHYVTFID
jgi:hypothetical protein